MLPASPPPGGQETGDRLLPLDEMRRAADMLKDLANNIQTRANVLLALTGTMLSLALGTASKALISQGRFGFPAIVFLALSMAVSGLAVGSVGLSWYNPDQLPTAAPDRILHRVEGDYVRMRKINFKRVKLAANLLRVAIVCVIVGVSLTAASVVQAGGGFASL